MALREVLKAAFSNTPNVNGGQMLGVFFVLLFCARRMSHASSHRLVLAISLFLLFAGLVLTVFSLFSAQWQVMELDDLHVTHLHGIWRDCIQPSPFLIPLNEDGPRAEQCIHKFDKEAQKEVRRALEYEDAARHELLLHRFLPQHKAVLFFSVFTFLFGFLGAIVGICSPCFPPNSILFVVSLFLTAACSVLADVIFVTAAMRPEVRTNVSYAGVSRVFDLGKYENKLGMAAFLHMLSSGLIVTSFLSSLGSAYLLLVANYRNGCCPRIRPRMHFDEEDRWRGPGVIIRPCDDAACRPFVVMPDASSDDS